MIAVSDVAACAIRFCPVCRQHIDNEIHGQLCAVSPFVNGKSAKASYDVKVGDVITIQFGNKETKVEVLQVKDVIRKEEADDMYKYL